MRGGIASPLSSLPQLAVSLKLFSSPIPKRFTDPANSDCARQYTLFQNEGNSSDQLEGGVKV